MSEKAGLLNSLTKVSQAKTALEASESLRQWQRQLLCAQELGLQAPDPLFLVGSLTEIMKQVLGRDQQASFRVNAFRMSNMVDVAPTQVTMQSYLQLLIAEADHLHLSTAARTSTTSTPEANPKLKAMGNVEKGNKGQGKTGGSPQGQQGSPVTSTRPCRHWGTDAGCKLGRASLCTTGTGSQTGTQDAVCAAAPNTWQSNVMLPKVEKETHPRRLRKGSPLARASQKVKERASLRRIPLLKAKIRQQ